MYCTELLPLQYSTVHVGSDNCDHDPRDRQPFRGPSEMADPSTCVIESQTGLATVRGNEYSMVAGLGALQVAEIDSRDLGLLSSCHGRSRSVRPKKSSISWNRTVAGVSGWRLVVSPGPILVECGARDSLVYSRYCIVRMRWHGKTSIKFLVLPFLLSKLRETMFYAIPRGTDPSWCKNRI